MFDVVIVGGSFAGLATAMELRGFRVLVIDQYPIGAHQSSTCGTPLAVARAVGAASSISKVHETIVLHAGGRTIRFAIPEPYVTLDYHAFCQAMLAQTGAAVRPHTVFDQRIDLAAAVPSGRVLATTSCEEHRA